MYVNSHYLDVSNMSFSDVVSWFRQTSDISEKADHVKLLETLVVYHFEMKNP